MKFFAFASKAKIFLIAFKSIFSSSFLSVFQKQTGKSFLDNVL